MLAQYMLQPLSVCVGLSVCPTQVGTVSKRLNLSSNKYRSTIA